MTAYDCVMDLMRRNYIAKTHDKLSILVLTCTINKVVEAALEAERLRIAQVVSNIGEGASTSDAVRKILNPKAA